MDTFKLELFKENHKFQFPEFVTLDKEECEIIRITINQTLQLEKSVDPIETVNTLLKVQDIIDGVNAKDDDFNLLSQLAELEILPEKEIYVNWHRFDEIDKFSRETILKYFTDIWYPGSDDVDLFDNSFSWIVSIQHDGCIGKLLC